MDALVLTWPRFHVKFLLLKYSFKTEYKEPAYLDDFWHFMKQIIFPAWLRDKNLAFLPSSIKQTHTSKLRTNPATTDNPAAMLQTFFLLYWTVCWAD